MKRLHDIEKPIESKFIEASKLGLSSLLRDAYDSGSTFWTYKPEDWTYKHYDDGNTTFIQKKS